MKKGMKEKDDDNIIKIWDIHELPQGQPHETTLHPKRRRVLQRSSRKPPPSPSPSPSPASPPVEDSSSVPSPQISSPKPLPSPSPSPASTSVEDSSSVPTPQMFVECQTSSLQHPSTSRQDNDEICYGSEPESDESDDEEDDDVTFPRFFSRVLLSHLETPFDEDTGEGDAAIDPTDTPAEVSPTATDQPWGPYQFDWRPFPDTPIPPESRREAFSVSNVGPTTPSTDPYDIFIEIWDRQIMEHIASETNKYAQQLASQKFDDHTLRPRSRISQWRDTTVDEIYVYFAILLAMGIVVKHRLEDYWNSSADIISTPGFGVYMSIDRFLLIRRCMHFNDNEKMAALKLDCAEARLFKIQPILSHLNKKFQEMYIPAQNISLDESLLMWKGWREFSQHIPSKAAGRGIKTYEICESQTGYLWRFQVNTHNKKTTKHADPLEASTPSTVIKLLQGLEHKGYTVWMDNFYNSPYLARYLKSKGFDCVGTLRTDRKFVPQSLHNITKQSMHNGQIAGLTSGDVDVMVWKHMNRVAMISTYHGNAQHESLDSTKPILILDYNIMMGGVDKKDQLLATYPVERKHQKVWYKKLFQRLLNVSVLNSYIIHHHTSLLTHQNFRRSLVKSLLSKHYTPVVKSVLSNDSGPPPIPFPIKKKVDVTHRIGEYPMGNHQRMRRACVVCKKQVHTYCVGCSRTVCINPCFVTIHS